MCLCLLAVLSLHAAEDPFKAGVRPTDALTPEQEQLGFELPEGFAIQLFAAEPELAKPMNMALDAEGRLWVTDTLEYPTPVPLGQKGRDCLKILEDTDGDGAADKVTVFADGLNIPTGVHPFADYSILVDGKPVWACLVWSIPHIWLMRDLNGDGIADERKVLYESLGWEKDTHGMHSSFTRASDGWVYVTHGFRNDSTIRGRDGSEIVLNSGNTYRIRKDGSRVEQHTWGQVNPFGMCLDPWGNLYTADCHSSPVYQLIRGGYYPSFGKPNDGLGFAPVMVTHSHGSTAICGIVFVDDPSWPEDLQGNVLIGNVMTSRINRDQIDWHGSSPVGREVDDFLKASDPWFRPVDLQMGPDGALYVADFYNKIIGHYEVPLDHPGRDREKGRIWRITYHGSEGNNEPEALPSVKDPFAWITELDSSRFSRRLLAAEILGDWFSSDVEIERSMVLNMINLLLGNELNPEARAELLWVLHLREPIPGPLLEEMVVDPSPLVRNHVMRILGNLNGWEEVHRRLAVQGLVDSSPRVRRAAVEAIGLSGDGSLAFPIVQLIRNTDTADTHLIHTARIALKECLAEGFMLGKLGREELDENDSRIIADVCLALKREEAGSFILKHLSRFDESKGHMADLVRHAAANMPVDQLGMFAGFAMRRFGNAMDLQVELFRSVDEGLRARGVSLPDEVIRWGAWLASELVRSVEADSPDWSAHPVPGMAETQSPWFGQERISTDGEKDWFLCSLPPRGERLTGRIRSRSFQKPDQLSFFIAGHDGFPKEPAKRANVVRLRKAHTHEVLREVYPPRHDTAHPVKWDLSDLGAKEVYLEAEDGDNGNAYAWLAFGRVEPPVVKFSPGRPDDTNQRLLEAGALTGKLGLESNRDAMKKITLNAFWPPRIRGMAGWALTMLEDRSWQRAYATLMQQDTLNPTLRDTLGTYLAKDEDRGLVDLLMQQVEIDGLTVKLFLTLATHDLGRDRLKAWVQNDRLKHRLVFNQSDWEQVQRVDGSLHDSLRELEKRIEAQAEPIDQRIAALAKSFAPDKASAARGEAVFQQNCVACHQVGGKGALVGPQLDGILSRGVHRVLEDVLVPNRYLDPGFRAITWDLKDDTVVTGLVRSREGERLTVVDTQGKEYQLKASDIVHEAQSELSLMPANFKDLLDDQQLRDLVRFLSL